MPRETENEGSTKHRFLCKTYFVTVLMLLVGQAQVILAMQFEALKKFLRDYYYVSLMQFFISFISIQLYVFFYHILEQKALWVRIVCGLWTFESNTISIMKPAKKAPNECLGLSWIMTFVIMGLSICYGNLAVPHKRGLFLTRHNVIRWSERIFVLTSFGIIVCSEMKRASIEFPTLFIYTMVSNVFVVIFAASMRKPDFYHDESPGDFILIGQLYYLNFYALYMGYVWTMAAGLDWYQDLKRPKEPAVTEEE
ncbi:uncharacterized protein LOC115620061 [Scaptodrosophila lebanonensis]|uniref:Uncharacterized protein LOC115620061 n=1 Tax=Drosophila lebanonensis TaxID=7225 RepID=A0A6J2SWV3_DROLE|nr:uncharacterized protein LOC115620061 [Scaptodrosophila lebanonensis]